MSKMDVGTARIDVDHDGPDYVVDIDGHEIQRCTQWQMDVVNGFFDRATGSHFNVEAAKDAWESLFKTICLNNTAISNLQDVAYERYEEHCAEMRVGPQEND